MTVASSSSSSSLSSLHELQDLRSTAEAAANVERVGNLDILTSTGTSSKDVNVNTSSQQHQQQLAVGICNLASFEPFSTRDGTPFNVVGTYEAVAHIALAAQHLNTGNGTIVPAVRGLSDWCPLKFDLLPAIDTALDERTAVDAIIDLTDPDNASADADASSRKRLPCAIIGALRSAVSVPTSMVSGLRGYPQISLGSTSVELDNKAQYPLFGRMLPSDRGVALSYVLLLRDLGVRYVAVLHVDDDYGTSFRNGIRLASEEYHPEMRVWTIDIPSQASSDAIRRAVALLADTRCTYFIGNVYDYQVNPVLEEAYEAGIAGTGDHNWMLDHAYYVIPNAVVPRNSVLDRTYRGTLSVGFLEFSGLELSVPQTLKDALADVRSNEKDVDYVRSLLPNGGSPFADADSFLLQPPYSPVAYDAAIAIGLSACRAVVADGSLDRHPRLDGYEHFHHFTQTSFEGATGRVSFDNVTGTRDPFSMSYILYNYEEDPDRSNSTHVTYKRQEDNQAKLLRNGQWEPSLTPITFNDGTTNIPSDLPPQEVETNYLTPGLRAGGLLMCAVILLQALFFMGWTFKFRNVRVIRHSQPIFLNLLCAGAFIMGASIIPLSIDGGVCETIGGCDAACMASPWLLSIGFTLMIAALYTKTHRINRIIQATEQFTRVTITPLDVAKPMIVMLASNILVLTLWTALDPLRYSTEVLVWDDAFDRPIETYSMCRNNNPLPYIIPLAIVNVGALSFAVFEASRTKGFTTEYDESAYIFKSMTGFLVSCFVGIPVLVIAYDDPAAFYYVCSAIIFLTCSLVLLFIFIPKIRTLHFNKTSSILRDSEDANPSSDGRSSQNSSGAGSPDSSTSRSSRRPRVGISITFISRKRAVEIDAENRRLLAENNELRNQCGLFREVMASWKEKHPSLSLTNTPANGDDRAVHFASSSGNGSIKSKSSHSASIVGENLAPSIDPSLDYSVSSNDVGSPSPRTSAVFLHSV